MDPWRLTDAEWELLGGLLRPACEPSGGPGRPRLDDDRAAAEACLYRHFHGRGSGYRCFGWNRLPKEFGLSPATANRRFRVWTANGSWLQFWDALQVLRRDTPSDRTPARSPKGVVAAPAANGPSGDPEPWPLRRSTGRFPVGDLLHELERAYLFFNHRFFGDRLPRSIGMSVERARSRDYGGYFCARIWHDDVQELGHICLHTSVVGNGPELALTVLLHEMIHLRNQHLGLRDCHGGNQYHNRYFRDLAEVSGLACSERHKSRGYAFTALDARGKQAVVDLEPRDELFRWNPTFA